MAITPFDYHSNPEQNNYQYVSLKKIVDDLYLETQQDDSYIKNTRRYMVLQKVKSAIQELHKNTSNEIKAVELEVPENLAITLPHDFVDYVRISVAIMDENTNSYRLQPLNMNSNINIANGYLQDHNAEILFDGNGGILMADSLNGYNKPYKKYQFSASCSNVNLDTTKLSKYGEFVIDKQRGTILFSSDLVGQGIVIEYLSDGLSWDVYGEEEIKVHKNMVTVTKDLAYFYLIERKRSETVPMNEKQRALLRFKTTRHEARLENCKFDLIEVERVMRLKSKF